MHMQGRKGDTWITGVKSPWSNIHANNDHICYCDYSIYCEPVMEPGRKGYLVTTVVFIFGIHTAKF